MLDRHIIFGGMLHLAGRQRGVGRAARLWRSERISAGLYGNGRVSPALYVSYVRLFPIIDPDQRRRKARSLRLLCDHEGDRLFAEQNPGVIKRPEGLPFGSD